MHTSKKSRTSARKALERCVYKVYKNPSPAELKAFTRLSSGSDFEAQTERIKFFDKQIGAVARIEHCPGCGSDNLAFMPGTGIHAAQLRCSDCDRWLKWVGKADLAKIACIAAQAQREGVVLP